mmetsp:Transcript_8533/g.26789  ORF Transcript_8533/g.26789 Transcript_8533/m.26789 type:complete len:201 (+) Transcript_8533:241-843(+)
MWALQREWLMERLWPQGTRQSLRRRLLLRVQVRQRVVWAARRRRNGRRAATRRTKKRGGPRRSAGSGWCKSRWPCTAHSVTRSDSDGRRRWRRHKLRMQPSVGAAQCCGASWLVHGRARRRTTSWLRRPRQQWGRSPAHRLLWQRQEWQELDSIGRRRPIWRLRGWCGSTCSSLEAWPLHWPPKCRAVTLKAHLRPTRSC